MFRKILIANRGEIALRIQRACRELGIATVAVHSTADAEAMHVRLADESVCIGPPAAKDSYLNIPAILSAAAITGADAIHPGYGFLSENAGFAEMVEAHGLTFIGPSSDHIGMMGDKIAAKAAMAAVGVPLVPGSDGAVPDLETARAVADRIGYPVLIKAAAGGGGRGMKVARDADGAGGRVPRGPHRIAAPRSATTPSTWRNTSTSRAISSCRSWPTTTATSCISASATAACSGATRSCWRRPVARHQSPAQRDALGETATAALRKLGYRNAGTLEFLYQDGQFAFIEMNTRLQVEHPVTEMVCDVDLVREQIRIAAGAPLGYEQKDISFNGHAIECRITAEDPDDLHADTRPGHRVPCARRTGRARRLRRCMPGILCRRITTAWSPS